MNKHDLSDQHFTIIHKQSSKGRYKLKDLAGKSKDFETICLDQSELKHMHAIRPYGSKQRKSTRRQSKHAQSPHQLSRSKSKRFESSSKKTEQIPSQMSCKQLTDMYSQLINLKSEYKVLKNSYNKLLIDKKQGQKAKENEKKSLLEEIYELKVLLEKQAKINSSLEKELQRIKKECCKILQMEKFKIKKLEQTIQQKELMIAYLRNELGKKSQVTPDIQNGLAFIQNSAPLSFDYFNKPNITSLSHIQQTVKQTKNDIVIEDSLSFSQDKYKQSDSIIQSFLSNDQSLIHHNFTKKQNGHINSLNESPIQQAEEIFKIEEESQKSEKSDSNHQPPPEQFRFTKVKEPNNEQKLSQFKSIERPLSSKSKLNTKRLQISTYDQNVDSINLPEQLNQQTKKKAILGSCLHRQKKKQTSKKAKVI